MKRILPSMNEHVEKFLGTLITALAFTSSVGLIQIYMSVPIQSPMLISAFLLCFSGYIYLRFTMDNVWNVISIACSLMAVVSMILYVVFCSFEIYQLYQQNWWIIFIIILIWLYHSQRFLRYIRGNVYIKPLVIAFVWMALCYFYIQKMNGILYFQQFVLISTLTIPFDIKGKNKDNFLTIPQWLGEYNSKILIAILLSIYTICAIFLGKELLITALCIDGLLLIFLKQNITFYGIWTYVCYDGIIILQCLLYVLTHNII